MLCEGWQLGEARLTPTGLPGASAPNYRPGLGASGKRADLRIGSVSARTSGSIRAMRGILETAQAAFTLVLLLVVGWTLVFIAGSLVERKIRGRRSGPGVWTAFAWVWDNANAIGIPTLILGAVYMIWALNYGPGIGGPSLLVLMLMAAAVMLIGFAPSLRRR